MSKDIILINGIILFYLLQRLSELFISKGNERWLSEHFSAVEVDPADSFRMRLFHSFWFLSLAIEANLVRSFQPMYLSMVIYLLLILCLAVRLHTMEKLDRFWTIKVFEFESPLISTNGLFSYVRHPNYFIVIIELLLIPLLLRAYLTMIIFSIGNFYILKKRIELEERSLMKHSNYKQFFSQKKRFIPYLFSFLILIVSTGNTTEVLRKFNNYSESKKSSEFIRFSSESTKLGFITTEFDGYARQFKLNYDIDKKIVKNIKATIEVKELDTDNGSRNEKMIQTILNAATYPIITAEVLNPVSLIEGNQATEMFFQIKGKRIAKKVHFKILNTSPGHHLISGQTTIKLSELDLPDPSIAIAKVRDDFDLSFSFVLSEQGKE